MMRHAEENGILAPEQYVSRKRKTAIECALNKRLIFDLLQQTKRPAGICSCDLKSCYDRIIHSFASIAMQRADAPAAAIESMFSNIQQLKHTVRTCHGDSTRSFGGEDMGSVVVPEYASDQSAYRSEIAGIYAMVLVVEMIKVVWELSVGGILIGCDGKEALK